ncbi:MAG TPA: TlpA disulfide reductase family protein [Anaeromyxobacteraceae bacterium]|nr:TlpA disulfide reductase family protein [Anaeromyxobacteraceae bacterium]
MKSWIKLGLLAVAAVAAAELYLARARTRPPKAPAGDPAPGFSLADTSGKTVSLAGLKGRVVALNFWATWCGPCREEIPDLAKVYTAHKNKCFEMLGVAEESGARDEVVAAAEKLGVNYPVLLDDDEKVSDLFKIEAYPRTILIDADGNVRRVFEGQVERDDLEKALAPLLAEAPSSCRRT